MTQVRFCNKCKNWTVWNYTKTKNGRVWTCSLCKSTK